MKKILVFCVLAGILALTNSCSNEVDLTTDWKDIHIVYGLLNRQDTAHYIRIQKAYLDPKANALDIAQNPDSLYYDELTVQVERLSNNDIIDLERVDGNLEGFVREEGVFSDEPNYLYKFKLGGNEKLAEGETYRLKINRGDDLPEVTADATIVSDLRWTGPFEVGPLKIEYKDFPVSWRSESDASFFDLKMLIHYKDDSEQQGVFTDKTLEWVIDKNIPKGESVQSKYDIPGEEFYIFIGSELEEDPNVTRFFTALDFVIIAGGEEIFEYINIGSANTGITSSQVIPTYTNLSEGLGVFSSRNIEPYEGFSLQVQPSLDSLRFGIHTKDLNFQ